MGGRDKGEGVRGQEGQGDGEQTGGTEGLGDGGGDTRDGAGETGRAGGQEGQRAGAGQEERGVQPTLGALSQLLAVCEAGSRGMCSLGSSLSPKGGHLSHRQQSLHGRRAMRPPSRGQGEVVASAHPGVLASWPRHVPDFSAQSRRAEGPQSGPWAGFGSAAQAHVCGGLRPPAPAAPRVLRSGSAPAAQPAHLPPQQCVGTAPRPVPPDASELLRPGQLPGAGPSRALRAPRPGLLPPHPVTGRCSRCGLIENLRPRWAPSWAPVPALPLSAVWP